MNKLILTVAALVTTVVATAQTESTEITSQDGGREVPAVYAKNRFTVAATIGYNSYTSKTAEDISGSYSLRSGYESWMDSGLFVGVEGGWFFSDAWKLTLDLGLSHTYRPGYMSVPGAGDATQGGIPSYAAVANEASTSYRISSGVNWYMAMPNTPKLAFYSGANLGFSYGIQSMKRDEVSSQGISVGESLTFSTSLVSGIEYTILPEMYVAIQVNPIVYSYNLTSIKPVPGISPLKANAHNFSFIGSPTLKVGFTF